MLFVLSPAKSLDYESVPSATVETSDPKFLDDSARLIRVLKKKSAAAIAELMHLSPALAALNAERFGAWRPDADPATARPAVFAFDGDVYRGLQARSWNVEQLMWAQSHLAILSGLYGVLRPLDALQPYRLEMGTRLRTRRGETLYAYWGDVLSQHLNALAASDSSPVIVNLASQEYFKAIDRPALKPRVIDCAFEDWNAGGYRTVSFHAKRARGLMARYAVEHRVGTPAGLRGFNLEGYGFAADQSTADRFVFRRRDSVDAAA